MLNKSPELKAQRGYVEPDSFVRLDGSEKLVGRDWKKRKQDLWIRSGGYCEWLLVPYLERIRASGSEFAALQPCRSLPDDPHHLMPRSKRRNDEISNLVAICRFHHILLDERKIGGRK